MAYQFDTTDLVPGGGVLPKLKAAAKDAASRLGTILPGLGNASWAARDVLRYLEGKKQREQFLNVAGRNKPPRNGMPDRGEGTLADVENSDPFVPEQQPRGDGRFKWPLSVRTPLQKLTYAAKVAKYINTAGWPASAVLHALELSGKYPFEPFEEYYQAHDIADLAATAKKHVTTAKNRVAESLSSSYRSAPYIFSEPPPPPKWWRGPHHTNRGGPGEKPPKYRRGHPKAWTNASSLRWMMLNAKGGRRDDAEEAEFSELNSHPDNWHRQVQDELMNLIRPRTHSFSLDPQPLLDIWEAIRNHPMATAWGAAGIGSLLKIILAAKKAEKDDFDGRNRQSANTWSPNSLPRQSSNDNPFNPGRPRRAASQDVYAQLARRAGAMT